MRVGAGQGGGQDRKAGMPGECCSGLRLAFVWQERAGAEHQPPAGAQETKRVVDQAGLQFDEARDFGPVAARGRSG